jgi:spore coat protein H
MDRAGWFACVLVSALTWTGCTTDVDADPAAEGRAGRDRSRDDAKPAGPEIERPEGWDEATHGRGTEADYARLFGADEVHRIDIVMTPDSRQQMLDDMEGLIGKLGAGGSGFGPPRGGQTSNACQGRAAGDACSLDMNDGEGTCRQFGSQQMFCLPNNFRPGSAAIDLIGGDPMYVPVTVEYDGERFEHVAMRFKGNSSLRGSWSAGRLKLGFRLNFDHYETEHPEITDQRFFGFSEMTFSSGFRDPSMIRDRLAAELASDFGLTTARCSFVRIYVDSGAGSEYWGLYTMIEDPSDELIEEQFADGSGNVYKPDGPGANWTRFDEAGFVKKTNQEQADYGDVMSAVEALHASREDGPGWRAALESTFDVDDFLKVLAFSRSIGHWDGYGVMAHNYYLYGDPSQGGRLVWISWDHNLTWQSQMMGFGRGLSVAMDEVTEDWPLIRYLLDDPVYRARYGEALGEMLEGAYAKERFDARAAELHDLVEPFVLGDEGEHAPFTTLDSAESFSGAIDDPKSGLRAVADGLRSAVEAVAR